MATKKSTKELILERVKEKMEELINDKKLSKAVAKEIIDTIKNGRSSSQKVKGNLVFDSVLEVYLDKSEFTQLPSGKYNGSCDKIHKQIKPLRTKIKKAIDRIMNDVFAGKISIEEGKKLKENLEGLINRYKDTLKSKRDEFIKDNKIDVKAFVKMHNDFLKSDVQKYIDDEEI